MTLPGRELSALKKPRLWFGMAYAMLVLVGVLSLTPSAGVGGSDKLIHFVTYFILSVTFTTLVQQNSRLILVVTGLIGYGILLEYLQGLTGYRFMEGYDMLANSAGVFCGVLLRFTALPVWFRRIEMHAMAKVNSLSN